MSSMKLKANIPSKINDEKKIKKNLLQEKSNLNQITKKRFLQNFHPDSNSINKAEMKYEVKDILFTKHRIPSEEDSRKKLIDKFTVKSKLNTEKRTDDINILSKIPLNKLLLK